MVVGRITAIDGQLLRFVPENKDWLATVKDAPFGLEDSLYSGQDTRAEIDMPFNAWIRLGASTQVQLIAAETDVIEISVSSGVTRFLNESEDTLVKATTSFGYVVAEPGSSFDLYVGDQSVEIIAITGTVDFMHGANNAKYQVEPGAGSVIADMDQVGSGDGTVDADWSDWNESRDDLWSKRAAVSEQAARYLPPQLRNDGYELAQNGRWERVVVAGRARDMWRPTMVGQDWSPFTAGRWTEWNGDQTWIPDEPFGYTTHHYGNWQFVNNYWYWAPPPVVEVFPSWYPGRVAWVGSEENVGWVPLAPEEPYYGHHNWGPAAIVVGTVAVSAITVAALVNLRHTVVVPHERFYRSNNYTSVRNVNINTNVIINNYNSSHIVNKKIINNYNTNPERFAVSNQMVQVKPHASAMANIRHSPLEAGPGMQRNKLSAGMVKESMQATRVAIPSTRTALPPPRITSKLVPANEVNLPPSKVEFKEINPKMRPVAVSVKDSAPGPNSHANQTLVTTPGVTTPPRQEPGPHPPISPRTSQIRQTDPNKQVPTTLGGSTAPAQSTGPHAPIGPRTPQAPQHEADKQFSTAPGAMPQSPKVVGPHKPISPRATQGPQADQNKQFTTPPAAVTHQPDATASQKPRLGEEPSGLRSPRTPQTTPADLHKPITTPRETTKQQPGLIKPPTAAADQVQQQQLEQQQHTDQQQQQQHTATAAATAATEGAATAGGAAKDPTATAATEGAATAAGATKDPTATAATEGATTAAGAAKDPAAATATEGATTAVGAAKDPTATAATEDAATAVGTAKNPTATTAKNAPTTATADGGAVTSVMPEKSQ